MRLVELFQKEVISLVFTLVSTALLFFFRARAKLVWSIPHGFTFLLQSASVAAAQSNQGQASQAQASALPATVPQSFNIYTGSIVVFNAGRVPATEVEVTFNWRPDNYNIWPVRPHETQLSPDSRFTLKFANIAPKEQFMVELISPGQLPMVMNVRCKECVGKQIAMRPMVVWPNWVLGILWGLVLLGATAVIYFILKQGSAMLG
jgi:hypothetical protein